MMKPMKLIAILLVNASLLTITALPALAKPKLNQACQQPSPVVDIWSLEPMLIKSRVLNDSMTQTEKERVIRDYIKQKNDKYRQCLGGGETASSCKKPKMNVQQIETNLLNEGVIAQDTKDEQKQLLIEEYRHKSESAYRLCQLKQGASL